MAKTIHATEDDIQRFQPLTDTLQLQDLCVVDREFHPDRRLLILYCVPRWEFAVCPHCGLICTRVHDYPKQRTIHDAPLRGYRTWLVFDSRRFECERCASSFTGPIRDVVPNCTYTYRLQSEVTDPRRRQDVATLAALYGLGYKLVEGMLLKAAQAKLHQRVQDPIAVHQLGIDELSNRKGHGNYVLILTDLERRILLDVLPDRKKQTLIDWLQDPPPGIELTALDSVATDLWSHYRDAVQTVFPTASVVADRFHVVQNLNQAINETRREAQRNAATAEETSQLKGLHYLLLKNKSKLTDSEAERLAELRQTHPQLYELCDLRQRLYEWYETETAPETAQESLAQWIADATALGLSHLDAFCDTLLNWQPEILNFFTHRITSGFVEGMNGKIRLLKRIAFGLPNFEHFRLRMIWACG